MIKVKIIDPLTPYEQMGGVKILYHQEGLQMIYYDQFNLKMKDMAIKHSVDRAKKMFGGVIMRLNFQQARIKRKHGVHVELSELFKLYI